MTTFDAADREHLQRFVAGADVGNDARTAKAVARLLAAV